MTLVYLMLGLFVLSAVLILTSGDGSSSNSQQQSAISSGPFIYSGQSININGVPYAEPVKYRGAGGLNGYRIGLANGGSIITGHSSYVGTRGDPLLAEALRISDHGIGSISGVGKLISSTSGDDDSSKSVSIKQKYLEPAKPEPKKVVIPKPRPEVQYHTVPVAETERHWIPQPEVINVAEPEPVRSSVVSVRPEAYRDIIHSYDNTKLHVPVAEHSYTAFPVPAVHSFTGYSPELYSTRVYHPVATLQPVRLFSMPSLRWHGLHLNHFGIHKHRGPY